MRRNTKFRSTVFLALTVAASHKKGLYDAQYADRVVPDCRGRFVTDKSGKYGYRAVVPVAYAITDSEGVSFFLSFFLFFGVINPTPLGPRIPIRARSMNSF